MAKRGFRDVLGLFVFADFSEVEAGRARPPRVNHDQVDFEALGSLLANVFEFGPPVTISVGNDTIDQVTVQARMGVIPGMRGKGDPQCTDFGEAMLKLTPATKPAPPVIDVRAAWSALHNLPDRRIAPPPMIIPFLVRSDDFYDGMAWIQQSWMVLGRDVISESLSDDGDDDEDKELGHLPKVLQDGLQRVFGCPFENRVMMHRLASDKLPLSAQRLL